MLVHAYAEHDAMKRPMHHKLFTCLAMPGNHKVHSFSEASESVFVCPYHRQVVGTHAAHDVIGVLLLR